MASGRVDALRREREEVLRFCQDLDEAEWRTESAATGWRVQDVVAHIGSSCHALFTPASLTILCSKDIERTNDVFVDRRRDWEPKRTLAEYEKWSGRMTKLVGGVERTPLSRVRIPMAELGRFPTGLVLVGAMLFDHHTHLRHDLAPRLGRPAPDTDPARMTMVLQWMFGVLGNQLRKSRPDWFDRPVAITLHGPGGGDWRVDPDGTVASGATEGTAAQIVGNALEFPEWATRRAPWRDRDVKITGDDEYGARFLDVVKVI